MCVVLQEEGLGKHYLPRSGKFYAPVFFFRLEGVAWLTKDEFKVNETYDCWYMLGISKVNLYHDGFFNCHANDPSMPQMFMRYFFLSSRVLISWFASLGRVERWRWE